MGSILHGKIYPRKKYLTVRAIVVVVGLFMGGGDHNEKEDGGDD